MFSPGGGSFAEELHETALHHEPEAARHVKYDSEEDEVQGDPLVIRVIHYCVITVVLKASNELLKRKKHRELKRMDSRENNKIKCLYFPFRLLKPLVSLTSSEANVTIL